LQFNDYENNQYGSLLVTSANDKKLFLEKNVYTSVNVGSNKTWESLRTIYCLIQKDYRKKFECFKTSGNQVMEDLILSTLMSASSDVMPIHWKL
jgi:hypothetical protein